MRMRPDHGAGLRRAGEPADRHHAVPGVDEPGVGPAFGAFARVAQHGPDARGQSPERIDGPLGGRGEGAVGGAST